MENLDSPLPSPPNQGRENGAFWLLRCSILDMGGGRGWGFAVPFYFVQDCSFNARDLEKNKSEGNTCGSSYTELNPALRMDTGSLLIRRTIGFVLTFSLNSTRLRRTLCMAPALSVCSNEIWLCFDSNIILQCKVTQWWQHSPSTNVAQVKNNGVDAICRLSLLLVLS